MEQNPTYGSGRSFTCPSVRAGSDLQTGKVRTTRLKLAVPAADRIAPRPMALVMGKRSNKPRSESVASCLWCPWSG